MNLRVYTLRLDPVLGMFDDSAMRADLEASSVVSYAEHFFVHDGRPTLAILVAISQLPGPAPAARRPTAALAPVEIPPDDQPLFDLLRRWRNERAKRDGRPPYLLFTNPQLAAIAHSRPDSRAALAAVPGVGEARVRDYADDILELTRGAAGGGPIDPAST